ncbi:hypothetical protein [Chryseobacterium rhizosphaerae]|uniref:hypothetical protein n=1 Tax=Chryseobacterium rhizosphaerae TaxID=395937 RepID=UPI0023597F71|nr:hypothetical protein [Chryseobacterium rhizosphaerae]MDC8102650.1 hypothetical protein [Chryseobacterium rhizosphaerae]
MEQEKVEKTHKSIIDTISTFTPKEKELLLQYAKTKVEDFDNFFADRSTWKELDQYTELKAGYLEKEISKIEKIVNENTFAQSGGPEEKIQIDKFVRIIQDQNSEIMKNNLFESKKADLQVKIDLPGQEKPFFDKMSTPNNLVTQIQKAGQKLEEKENLSISINGASFEIPKEKTEKGNILETVQSEYEKAQKNNTQAKETTDDEEAKRTESQQNEAPAKQKEKTNFGYLKDQIKYLGMGEDPAMHKELAKKTGSGVKEFSMVITSDKASFKNNKVEFMLNFQKSSTNNKVYLNTFQATLKNEEKNMELTHTFSANGRITAKEAINLLEGRSVKTEINSKHSDEKEEAFIKLLLSEEKNEKGNFKLQVFNKNYGIDVEKIMAKSKLVFDDEKHKEITQKSLEKGNIVSVKFSDQNNKVTEGKAILNPQYKMLNLYDNKMKRVNSNEQAFQKDNSESKEVKNQQNYSRKM